MHSLRAVDMTTQLDNDDALIRSIVRRYRWATRTGVLTVDDLMQVGRLALVKARSVWDHNRCGAFIGFAHVIVTRHVRRAAREQINTVRVPERQQTDAWRRGEQVRCPSVLLKYEPRDADDPEAVVDRIDCARAVAALPERERRVVEHHFGRDASLDEVGAALGISGERARQLKARALRRLAGAL